MIKIKSKNFRVLVLSASLAIGATLTGSCIADETAILETPTRIIENATPGEGFALIQNNQNNPDFVILDVRTPEEFTDGHIENAIIRNFYSETFRDELNDLDKGKTYLIYCRSGNRSGNALNIMDELGFQEVYGISGGIIAWETEGLPTTK